MRHNDKLFQATKIWGGLLCSRSLEPLGCLQWLLQGEYGKLAFDLKYGTEMLERLEGDGGTAVCLGPGGIQWTQDQAQPSGLFWGTLS